MIQSFTIFRTLLRNIIPDWMISKFVQEYKHKNITIPAIFGNINSAIPYSIEDNMEFLSKKDEKEDDISNDHKG
jgi:hypothetical protein